ncbi:hypothetical protein ABW20_dc0109798 [Dactylellina cionopaga]|nr:hypothetical protein ABW20_dc0109798 [Dactylellina cionopaga]
MIAQSKLVDLASSMEGGTANGDSLLQGWDVLVSYDTKALNQLLAAQATTNANVQNVPEFKVDQKNFVGDVSDTYTFNLTLSNIAIEFLVSSAGRPTAPLEVTFKLGGQIKNKEGEIANCPDGVYLKLTTTLTHVQGTMSPDGSFTPTPGTTKAPGEIITTEPDVYNAVCIDLQQNKDLRIDYTATTNDGSGGVPLRPTSFVMTLIALPKNSGESGVLCFYIAVAGGVSGSDNKDGEKTGLIFSPSKIATNPIPVGRSATSAWDHWDIDGISFDINSQKSTMTVSPKVPTNDGTAAPSITMTYGTIGVTAGWGETYWNFGSKQQDVLFGNTHLDFACHGTYGWQEDNNTLTANANFPTQYTVGVNPGDNSFRWGQVWSSSIPDAWKFVKVDVPIGAISFPSVNYFLVTNLILPGQHVFKADKTVANVSDGKAVVGGFAMPWDMILTGTLAPQAKPELSHRAKINHRAKIEHEAIGHNGFFRPQPNTASAKSLEERFLDSILSTTDITLLTDINSCFTSDKEDDAISSSVLDFMAKHGFGDIKSDRLGDLMGFSLASEIALDSLSANDEVVHTPAPRLMFAAEALTPTFDLHAYSGVYKVNSDDTDLLIIEPATAQITYKSATRVPTITSDNNTNSPKYTVTWSTGSVDTKDLTNYSVVFTSAPQGSGFLQSFTGTVTANSKDSIFKGEKLVPIPKFDVRVAAGKYTISSPDDLSGAYLVVDRLTGEIVFEGEKHTPTQKVTSDGLTHLLWQLIDGTSFDAVFSMNNTTMAFNGKITDPKGNESNFSGKIPEEIGDSSSSSPLTGWEGLGNWNNMLSILFDLVQVGTLVLALYHYSQRKEKKERANEVEKAKMEKISKMVSGKVIKREKESIVQFRSIGKKRMEDQQKIWQGLLKTGALDSVIGSIAGKIAELHDSGDLPTDDVLGTLETLDTAGWEQVHSVAREALSETLQNWAKTKVKVFTVDDTRFLKAFGLDSSERGKLTQEVLDNHVQGLVEQLAGEDFNDNSTYCYSITEQIRQGVNSKTLEDAQQGLSDQADGLESIITEQNNNIRINTNKANEYQKALDNLKPGQDGEKKRLEGLKETLDAAIKKETRSRDKNVKDEKGLRENATDLETNIEDADTRKLDAEKEAEEAKKKVFER